ncbi:MAG: M14 family zinc carboxypeptidase [Candidatus Cloacimonetes bacterium]|nr:M14 family zinc carboxypeptidase [Candidatus Cloacimonadota bacterium]
MKKYILLSLLFALALSLSAKEWTQYYFRFELLNKAELKNITNIVSIDNVKGNWVYAYANDDEWKAFNELGYKTQLLPAPSSLIEPAMSRSVSQAKLWDTYPTYETYVATMYSFATSYPNLCQIVDTGTTVNGRVVLFAKISDNVNLDEAEPEVMYSATMHGDETVGFILMQRLIDTLLSNYGTDSRITNIVDNTELWICPNTNPDGTYYGGNSSVNSAKRYNWNRVDLNRNFPLIGGGQGDGNASQPENINMMNFMQSHHFVHGVNFHGGEEVVNYPWDYTSSLHPDDDWYISSSLVYANSAIANSPSGYMQGLSSSGITNGADWYVINGGRQDWVNLFNHGREVTIELSSTKMPDASTMPDYWNYNYDAMLSYIEQAHYGIHGIVHDPYGNPLSATISIAGHDDSYSTVITDPAKGDFYRYLSPGTYNLTFTVSGYPTKTVNGVVVNANTKTPLNVMMGELPAHTQNISLAPGWNMLSFNIDLGSNDYSSIFGSNLQQIKDSRQTYAPAMAEHFNTLPSVESAAGYWVNNSSSSTLEVQGQLLTTSTHPQSLVTGWNLVSYLPNTAKTISAALTSISTYLLEVRDMTSSSIGGTLTEMAPGKAYWVKVSAPCSLVYPN